MILTAERLRELVNYDPSTGIFTWNKSRRRCTTGKKAGCINTIGYQVIRIDDILYLAHRLAWLHVTGAWPKYHIDHINGERSDNRFANLRDIPEVQNHQNQRKPMSTNKTGFFGVCKKGRRFAAHLSIGDKTIWIGLFATPEEAHNAYLTKKRELHAGCTI